MSQTIAVFLLGLVASTASAGLALEIELEGSEIGFEAPVTYVVRFVNRGAEEIRYFEPLHAGSNTFPDVRVVREGDGRELRPYDAPFQSMVRRGLQGAVIRLAPGEKREYRYVRARFMTVDRLTQKADWLEPRALPDGTYEIRAIYSRGDDILPHNVGGFDVERRRVPGIFTGTVKALPVTLRVRAPTQPHVRISVPHRGTSEVVVSYVNPTDETYVFSGAARFDLSSKMYGSATAAVATAEMLIPVPAGGHVEKTVDLRALSWRRSRKRGEELEGLGEVVPEGVCHLLFVMEGGTFSGGDGIWIRVPPVPREGLEGIVVTARTTPPLRARVGQTVTLEVEVENRGEDDVGLAHRLAFPRELVVRIEDVTGRRRSVVSTTGKARGGPGGLRPRGENVCKIARGLSWNRDRFEPAPGLRRQDFVWIEPGTGILRTLDLTALLAGGLTPGQYRIRAGYRNVETGAGLGYAEGRRPGTGIVWSEPVILIVE